MKTEAGGLEYLTRAGPGTGLAEVAGSPKGGLLPTPRAVRVFMEVKVRNCEGL